MSSLRVVVCASGGGGNLGYLLENRSPSEYLITHVITDRVCPAESVAKRFGVKATRVPRAPADTFSQRFLAAIPRDTDLIVLAGYMTILPGEVIEAYPNKIINTHPSLLPRFGGIGMYGERVHQAVLESGVLETGCTVHYVDNEVDGGPILAQARVDVRDCETAWDLGGRVFRLEGPLLVSVIKTLARELS